MGKDIYIHMLLTPLFLPYHFQHMQKEFWHLNKMSDTHCIYTINYAIFINIHLHINNYSKIN